MDKILVWVNKNSNQITWFVVGWMTFAGIDALTRGQYVWGAVDLSLAFFNAWMGNRD